MEDLKIRSYGVSMTSLEDVFLKINQEYAPDLFSELEHKSDKSKSHLSNRTSKRSSFMNQSDAIHKSIGHSTMMSNDTSASYQ